MDKGTGELWEKPHLAKFYPKRLVRKTCSSREGGKSNQNGAANLLTVLVETTSKEPQGHIIQTLQ